MEDKDKKEKKGRTRARKWGRRLGKNSIFKCHVCRKELPFCWNCPCGFQICDDCMKENAWGLTNGPTWVCPDCGNVRMF